jgi:2-oxoglutarate ferredoxin oxidoreductase subunit beta
MTSDSAAATAKQKISFKNEVKPVWCPGCGDYSVLAALTGALQNLGRIPEHTAVISGIGCSSRLPGYLSCYGFNSIHGRAILIATGVKLSRPELTVCVTIGDGDCFAIGGGHVAHAVRRNIDMTLIVMDNGIYGLTKGQVSPTTPLGTKTKTTYYGAYEQPFNPLEVMMAYGCTFVAQGYAGDYKFVTSLIEQGIEHRGFSYIDVISPCPTYRGMDAYKVLREMENRLTPENHDASSWEAAMKVAHDRSRMHTGILYRKEQEIYEETQEHLREKAAKVRKADVVGIANVYR